VDQSLSRRERGRGEGSALPVTGSASTSLGCNSPAVLVERS
jgi:hypothetical protein